MWAKVNQQQEAHNDVHQLGMILTLTSSRL